MSSSYIITTPVAGNNEPISVADLKSWLRIDWSDDDGALALLISRARAYAETVTGRAFATQVVQMVETIERPIGGELSGPISQGPNWYQYQEQLGANPFGPAQFYFDLVLPPIQPTIPVTIETMITAFDGSWATFAGNTFLDSNREPARLYIQSPVTANFYRFTYTTGYDPSAQIIPYDLKHCLLELAAYWYDHRQAEGLPDAIMHKLLSHRANWL